MMILGLPLAQFRNIKSLERSKPYPGVKKHIIIIQTKRLELFPCDLHKYELELHLPCFDVLKRLFIPVGDGKVEIGRRSDESFKRFQLDSDSIKTLKFGSLGPKRPGSTIESV